MEKKDSIDTHWLSENMINVVHPAGMGIKYVMTYPRYKETSRKFNWGKLLFLLLAIVTIIVVTASALIGSCLLADKLQSEMIGMELGVLTAMIGYGCFLFFDYHLEDMDWVNYTYQEIGEPGTKIFD